MPTSSYLLPQSQCSPHLQVVLPHSSGSWRAWSEARGLVHLKDSKSWRRCGRGKLNMVRPSLPLQHHQHWFSKIVTWLHSPLPSWKEILTVTKTFPIKPYYPNTFIQVTFWLSGMDMKSLSRHRIAGNFQGRKLSRIGENTFFTEKTFAHLLAFAAPNDATPQIFRRKLSRIATKPQNSWKFSPSKVFRYTVYIRHCLRLSP